MIPDDAVVAADVYKAGRLAAHLWRRGDEVTFVDRPGYEGAPVATSLAQGSRIVERNFQLPAFFAGLLPEGATRRRSVARALHVAEDDELALLVQLGADTIGDVQVLPAGRPLPTDEPIDPSNLGDLTFGDLWAIPQRLEERSTVAGVQPKISHHSRSLIGGRANRVILKFSPDPSWYGVLENEAFFVRGGREVGLPAPEVEIVTDREGERALAVTRFDRSVVGGELRRHAQEDASQVLGIRPAQKYDPDAREVIAALADVCAAPSVARRDLLHQLLYSYAVGNNDVHAKNLSVGQDPRTDLWSVTPIYDVLHTWPYETDHRFHPRVRDRPHDTITRKHWLALADDLAIPARLCAKLIDRVTTGVDRLTEHLDDADLGMPQNWVRDLKRRIRRRVRDLSA